jgi:two-component system KDP operon response regulator KdpE
MADIREPRILVIDQDTSQALGSGLQRYGYAVKVTTDHEATLQALQEWSPSLLILNLTAPIAAGLHLCRRVRVDSRIPIIALTTEMGDEHKIEALDSGIDDLIDKPIAPDLLLAHIRVALRHSAPVTRSGEPWIETGEFRLDSTSRRVFVSNREVELTRKEYKLLSYLIANEHKVVTHRMLVEAIWGETNVKQPEALRSLIAHFRKKVEPNKSRPTYLRSCHCIGYRFTPSQESVVRSAEYLSGRLPPKSFSTVFHEKVT